MNVSRKPVKVVLCSSGAASNTSKNILKQIPILLKMYLCLHGLSIAPKFKRSCKSVALFAVSLAFILMNEVNKLYLIVIHFVQLNAS